MQASTSRDPDALWLSSTLRASQTAMQIWCRVGCAVATCLCMGLLAHDMLVPANLTESKRNADSVQCHAQAASLQGRRAEPHFDPSHAPGQLPLLRVRCQVRRAAHGLAYSAVNSHLHWHPDQEGKLVTWHLVHAIACTGSVLLCVQARDGTLFVQRRMHIIRRGQVPGCSRRPRSCRPGQTGGAAALLLCSSGPHRTSSHCQLS